MLMQEMRRSRCVFSEVQVPARDAVRVSLSSIPKRVVNFRDSEEAPNWGSGHDNSSSPRQINCLYTTTRPNRSFQLPHPNSIAALSSRHGLPITQCSDRDRQR
jgi:hypothetical protein